MNKIKNIALIFVAVVIAMTVTIGTASAYEGEKFEKPAIVNLINKKGEILSTHKLEGPGDKITLPDPAPKEGYEFIGWNLDVTNHRPGEDFSVDKTGTYNLLEIWGLRAGTVPEDEEKTLIKNITITGGDLNLKLDEHGLVAFSDISITSPEDTTPEFLKDDYRFMVFSEMQRWDAPNGDIALSNVDRDPENMIEKIIPGVYTYSAFVSISDTSNYKFADTVNVTFNGKKLTVNCTDENKTRITVEQKVTVNENGASKVTYPVIEGKAQEFDFSKDSTLTFRIDADYSLFKDGGKVYMDGKLVDKKYYTTREGSTIVEFKKEFVDTLSNGAHKLVLEFTDGGTAETTFTVKNNPKTLGKVTGANEEVDDNNNVNNPKTGDNLLVNVVIAIVSALGLVGLEVARRRKNAMQ